MGGRGDNPPRVDKQTFPQAHHSSFFIQGQSVGGNLLAGWAALPPDPATFSKARIGRTGRAVVRGKAIESLERTAAQNSRQTFQAPAADARKMESFAG